MVEAPQPGRVQGMALLGPAMEPSPFVQNHKTARESRDLLASLNESSDRIAIASRRLFWSNIVLVTLTVVLTILTAVLVTKVA